ncbi:serpin family protein [Megasphaera sp. ASD88]|uniref:serpin family protein n=1 Tax=Megasphaera sp. ASD88 TaxID=2027407 RepID=UPI00130401E7|nr:serpin family protein [Megasphaera sp. ASD88]
MNGLLEQSALKLFEQICQTQRMDNNILFSPYSLQQALSLLSVNTEDERIQQEVSPYVSPDILDESLLNTKSGTLILLKDEWKKYRTHKERGTIDFFSSPEDGEQKIIAFQRKHLGEILFQAKPTQNDGLGLYSALHYSAEWGEAFNKHDTQPRTFYLDNGKEIQPETMKSEFSRIYGKITDDYEVAALPGKRQSITYFIKPKTKKFFIKLKTNRAKVLHKLWDICNHDDELHNLVDLQMPKISMKSSFSLKPVLESLGMEHLTKERFTVDNIVDPSRVWSYLNEAEQAVQLSLDEEKAEVKAFTMVCSMQTVSCTVIKPKPIIIKMDHPYFVVVKDKTSDGISRIVCAAWINNPK